jgi:hypothetical protein
MGFAACDKDIHQRDSHEVDFVAGMLDVDAIEATAAVADAPQILAMSLF